MTLRQKVVLELEDGTEIPVVFDGRDLRQWETKFRRSSIQEPLSIGMLTWLGYTAAKRQGLLNGSYGTYEAFDAVCVGVEGSSLEEDTDEEANPTEAGPDTPPTP